MYPGGRWLFSRILGLVAPYTGTIPFVFESLAPGKAVVRMPDKRCVRNHLNSIHAIALVNLAEVASGVPLYCGLNNLSRGIIVKFSIQYLKKARGTLSAEADFTAVDGLQKQEVPIQVRILNSEREVVAEAEAVWLVSPLKAAAHSSSATGVAPPLSVT